MLHKIVERGLQPDVYVLYCNTGREDDRTLDFVRDCAKRFDVPIRYLEYRRRFLPIYKSEEVAAASDLLRKHFGCTPFFEAADGRTEPGFVEVDYDSAARSSDVSNPHHPFVNLLCMSGVPNPTTRLCTTEMKIRVIKKFMVAEGFDHWVNVVGIRADEPSRVARMRKQPPERWENIVPLADAGVTVDDVMQFWRASPFDLQLPHDPELGTYEGNCDFCHLKSDAKKCVSPASVTRRLDGGKKSKR